MKAMILQSACILAVLLALPVGAHALSVQIEADKLRYENGETARLTVTISNESDKPAMNVNISNFLPKGLRYAPEQGETAFKHEIIEPHRSVRHTLLVQRDQRVSVSESGGVRVTIEADKSVYEENDAAMLTITIENKTQAPVTNVNLANILPKGVKYAPGQKETAFLDAVIGPHERVTHKLRVMREMRVFTTEQDGVRVTVMRDKVAYECGETARLTVITENLTDLPIRNVRIANLLPDGLQYAPQQEQTAYADELVRPHDSVTHVFLVRQVATDIPLTGDGFHLLGVLGGALFSAAVLVILMQKRKTQSNRQGEEKG